MTGEHWECKWLELEVCSAGLGTTSGEHRRCKRQLEVPKLKLLEPTWTNPDPSQTLEIPKGKIATEVGNKVRHLVCGVSVLIR